MDRQKQIKLIRAAAQEAAQAQAILMQKGAPLESTAAGRLSRAVEDLCLALLPGEEEQRADAAFWATIDRR